MPRCPACSGEVREDSATSLCPHCGVMLSDSATRAAVAGSDEAAVSSSAFSPADRRLSQAGPVDDARLPPGRIFASRYRIVTLLGRGAMGEVYRADDLRLGKVVAVTLLAIHAAPSRSLQRFIGEVRLARDITHPNVCRVYDIGDADGWHYLSMEYVDGETLSSLLRRIGRMPREKALDITRQLCAGLAAAHDVGVLTGHQAVEHHARWSWARSPDGLRVSGGKRFIRCRRNCGHRRLYGAGAARRGSRHGT